MDSVLDYQLSFLATQIVSLEYRDGLYSINIANGFLKTLVTSDPILYQAALRAKLDSLNLGLMFTVTFDQVLVQCDSTTYVLLPDYKIEFSNDISTQLSTHQPIDIEKLYLIRSTNNLTVRSDSMARYSESKPVYLELTQPLQWTVEIDKAMKFTSEATAIETAKRNRIKPHEYKVEKINDNT